MYISPALSRVQQRIAELHPRPPAPSRQSTPTTFSDVLARTIATSTPAPSPPPTATTFADALARTPAAALAPPLGEVSGRPLVAANLRSYGNGKIPEAVLTSIGVGHHRLAAPAARAFTEMVGVAAANGIRIGITDSYRTYDEQVDLARRKGLYSQGGLAAKPGTSDHGWGLAVDLDLDARAQAWMRANAGRYGFVEDTPREPWHWAYHGTGM